MTGSPLYFNPRSREGSDNGLVKKQDIGMIFQSALPQRERLLCMCKSSTNWNFNPRSHKGSDIVPHTLLGHSLHISIHAPTKGATIWSSSVDGWSRFQSTLPQRERQIFTIIEVVPVFISIHAPTKGATFSSI